MRKLALLTAVATGAVLAVSQARATTILDWAQNGTASAVTGTAGATGTTITASGIAGSIDGIIAGATPPVAANFTLNATSAGNAFTIGGFVGQAFSGTFAITEGALNYLSGTFTDAIFGSGTSLTLSASDATAGESVTFSSNVIPSADLAAPQAISLSLASVDPSAQIVSCGQGCETLAGFTSSVTGDFSATTAAVPEPVSIALLGTGLVGIGLIRRRRNAGAAA